MTSINEAERKGQARQRHCRTSSIPLKVTTPGSPSTSRETGPSADGPLSALSPSTADLPDILPTAAASKTVHEASSTKASEKYGFVVYVGSAVAWYIYLIWALTPDEYLVWLGIEWYPSREWAILFPSWLMMAVVFVYVSYFALNIYNTPALDSLTTITDTQAHILPPSGKTGKPSIVSVLRRRDALKNYDDYAPEDDEDYIPPLYDLPPSLINARVFGRGRDNSERQQQSDRRTAT